MPLLFAADAVALAAGGPSAAVEGLAQLAASGLLGLGIINWWWRGNLVGGIAGRPLGLGNLFCFLSSSAALGRATQAGQLPGVMWLVVAVLAILSLGFAWRMFLWSPPTPTTPFQVPDGAGVLGEMAPSQRP
ncbi:hypothetical protein [Deinococcus navajonensis]